MSSDGDQVTGLSAARRAHYVKLAGIATEGPLGAMSQAVREYDAALDASEARATALRLDISVFLAAWQRYINAEDDEDVLPEAVDVLHRALHRPAALLASTPASGAAAVAVAVEIGDLDDGTLFMLGETLAVKSEYKHKGTEIPLAVIVGSGEFVEFPDEDHTKVRVATVADVTKALLKRTLCAVSAHAWVWTGGGHAPPAGLPCDCGLLRYADPHAAPGDSVD